MRPTKNQISRYILILFLMLASSISVLGAQGAKRTIRDSSSEELINRLGCESPLDYSEKAKIRDEISRRRQIDLLLKSYGVRKDDCQKQWIVEALYQIQKPKNHATTEFMRSIAGTGTDQKTWLALQYLARLGDEKAMATLSQNCYRYEIPSSSWGETLVLFGKQKYLPAAPCLIKSIGSAAGEQALEGLRLLFPHSPANFQSEEEARSYFEKRYVERSGKQSSKSTREALRWPLRAARVPGPPCLPTSTAPHTDRQL